MPSRVFALFITFPKLEQPPVDFKKALALNGYTQDQLTTLVCDVIRGKLTKYPTIPDDFMDCIDTVIDAIFMSLTDDGGVDKSCQSYLKLVEAYKKDISEEQMENLRDSMELKNEKGKAANIDI